MKKLVKLIALFGGLLLVLTGCGTTTTKVTLVGSTALQPLVQKIAGKYTQETAHLSLTIQGGGSGTGLTQVQARAVAVGNSDVFAEQQSGINASQLLDYKVAVVGIVPVVNKGVAVKNLTLAQLRGIFTGKYTNWKQLGGKNQKIVVINRAEGSGTRKTFEQSVMNGQTAKTTQEQDSNGTTLKMVAATPGAISYVALPYVTSSVKQLKINGVAATKANITTNKWQIWSYEHMYVNKKNKSQAAIKFIKYIQSHKIQQTVVEKLGYISIHAMKVVKAADGTVTQIKHTKEGS